MTGVPRPPIIIKINHIPNPSSPGVALLSRRDARLAVAAADSGGWRDKKLYLIKFGQVAVQPIKLKIYKHC